MTTGDARAAQLQRVEAKLEAPMLWLSAAWLVLLVIELIWGLAPPLQIATTLIWAVFVLEFLARFALAPRKLRFIATNAITLAALLIPAFRLLRLARIFRVARFARGATLVRVVAGANRSMITLRQAMRRRGAGYVFALTLLVCLLGALGMRTFEGQGESREAFDTFGECLWWTAMILTTMGSQAWPATAEGRILALLLSVYAFAVFGYVAAALASVFVGRDQAQSPEASDVELRALHDKIDALQASLERLTLCSKRAPADR